MVRFIGDIHGKVKAYAAIIADCESSIQVGDFNLGYYDKSGKMCDDSALLAYMETRNARFIRGNHDNPEACRFTSRCIPDGHCEKIGNVKAMFVGGAFSVDHTHLIEGKNWWPNEELSYAQAIEVIETYEKYKPDLMVTHDCPELVAYHLFNVSESTRTRAALSAMWEIHKPQAWIFGHYHKSKNENLLGTQFVCLEELEYLDLEL